MERRRLGLASTNMLLCRAERKTWQKEQWKKIRGRFPGLLESRGSLAAVAGAAAGLGVSCEQRSVAPVPRVCSCCAKGFLTSGRDSGGLQEAHCC